MSYKLLKKEVKEFLDIPPEAIFYKEKNNKAIYKNMYNDTEFYIVYKNKDNKFVIEYYMGECKC